MSSSIDSRHPISVPETADLFLSGDEFNKLVQNADFHTVSETANVVSATAVSEHGDSETLVSAPTEISGFSDLGFESTGTSEDHAWTTTSETTNADNAATDSLMPDAENAEVINMENKMLTENGDTAFRSSKNPLVDLFFELEEVTSGAILRDLLNNAWAHDSLATLKIIFNARSIHLGKASRTTFYRCCGWLAQNHPKTLLMNIQWLVRPLIEQPKRAQEDSRDATKDEHMNNDKNASKSDDIPQQGMAHGYWKDLLNLVALAANNELNERCEPAKTLNPARQIYQKRQKANSRKRKAPGANPDSITKPSEKEDALKASAHSNDKESAKAARDAIRISRHENIVEKFNNDTFYRLLHLTVARAFASQLATDLPLMTGDQKNFKSPSLAAKWSPTIDGFHDRHTFILSSIAEILYPKSTFEAAVANDRDMYLKHARESCRRLTISPLRKALGIVERDITANTFENIRYARVPSLAMKRYTPIFIARDQDRFSQYLEKVIEGKASISGAILLPSTLVSAARKLRHDTRRKISKTVELEPKSPAGQWATLCQRIRDSGTLESSIAVCDVSGSMLSPRFKDGTCPMDSAIGLSLLIAEVTEKPFGGNFITFSSRPAFVQAGGVDDKRSLAEMVSQMESSDWGGNTNFVAVFRKLILPMAIEKKIKKEDMVKQIFVFSDMQFDSAQSHGDRWASSYQSIKTVYEKSGYDMPKLIFWNLAGGRAGYLRNAGDPTAPKPVTSDEQGTALVSGYSQGQLKVFLDNGQFEDPNVEIEEVEEEDSDGEIVTKIRKKEKMDPLSTVRKAISHDAYSVLRVAD